MADYCQPSPAWLPRGEVELPLQPRFEKPLAVLMMLFILFAPNWLNFPFSEEAVTLISLLLALLHGYRVWVWRHREIARRPLLWVIYLAYLFLILGFMARAAEWLGLPKMIATHSFAIGGVGLATLGLMARVALGHTGRDVYQPPRAILPMILLLLMAALIRAGGPLLFPQFYPHGVLIAQLFWVAAFVIFLLVYTPKLISRRPDGKPG